jgi:hypothetical protein
MKRNMVRAFHASILVSKWLARALGLVMALVGCSPGAAIDQLPDSLGLPAGAPARPAAPYQYPAVHDMPPPRATAPMSDEEQFKLEKELRAVRDRQEAPDGKAGQKATKGQNDQPEGTAKMAIPPAGKKAAPPAEKLPSNAILIPPAGAKANP